MFGRTRDDGLFAKLTNQLNKSTAMINTQRETNGLLTTEMVAQSDLIKQQCHKIASLVVEMVDQSDLIKKQGALIQDQARQLRNQEITITRYQVDLALSHEREQMWCEAFHRTRCRSSGASDVHHASPGTDLPDQRSDSQYFSPTGHGGSVRYSVAGWSTAHAHNRWRCDVYQRGVHRDGGCEPCQLKRKPHRGRPLVRLPRTPRPG